jgi:hypothetical protein
MYDQMWNNITRHIGVSWQSVTALAGAFALFSLDEQKFSLDMVAALVVLVSVWQLAHVLDASHWFNRNLLVISNIEKIFLVKEDLRLVHYYFGKHRGNKMIAHFRLQWAIGGIIALGVLAYHFFSRVLPSVDLYAPIGWLKWAPYIVAAGGLWRLYKIWGDLDEGHMRLSKNSPGPEIDTSGIEYGPEHPTDSTRSRFLRFLSGG